MHSSINTVDAKALESAEQVEDVKMHQSPFTPEEERKLVRKLDLWYFCSLLFFFKRWLTLRQDFASYDGHIHSSKL